MGMSVPAIGGEDGAVHGRVEFAEPHDAGARARKGRGSGCRILVRPSLFATMRAARCS